jgi:hypothetical protein
MLLKEEVKICNFFFTCESKGKTKNVWMHNEVFNNQQ